MDSYRIEWKRSAAKELRKLPRRTIPRVLRAVEQLSADPYSTGVKKLVNAEHTYRLHVGVYRVIYSVLQSELTIEIIRVKHRKDAYR